MLLPASYVPMTEAQRGAAVAAMAGLLSHARARRAEETPARRAGAAMPRSGVLEGSAEAEVCCTVHGRKRRPPRPKGASHE